MTAEEAIEILSDVGDINRCCAEDAEALDMAIKALEQESCITMRDLSDKELKHFAEEMKKVRPQVIEQEPCEDCISRQAVKETIFEQGSAEKLEIDFAKLLLLQRAIKALPSVTPTRPTGKWIEKEDYNLDIYYECSECGADYCIEGDILIHKYCPNCGAKMVETKMAESEDEE